MKLPKYSSKSDLLKAAIYVGVTVFLCELFAIPLVWSFGIPALVALWVVFACNRSRYDEAQYEATIMALRKKAKAGSKTVRSLKRK